MTTRNAMVLIKIEVTKGTDVVPAVADAIELETLELSPEMQKMERKVYRASFGNRLPITGSKSQTLGFSARLRGSGTAGTAPKWARILGIGGFTITAGATVVMTLIPTGDTASIYVYRNGKLHKLIGCAASDLTITQDGNGFILAGSIKGKYVAVTDAAMPSTPVYDTGVFYSGFAPSFTYDSEVPIVRAYVLNINGEMAEHVDLNDETGFSHFEITDVNPGGSITVEDETVAVYDWRGEAELEQPASAQALTWGFGTGAGNLVDLSAPSCSLGSPTEGDEGGIATLEMPYYIEALTPGAALLTITTA